jgi:hypothetical protein
MPIQVFFCRETTYDAMKMMGDNGRMYPRHSSSSPTMLKKNGSHAAGRPSRRYAQREVTKSGMKTRIPPAI